MSEGKFPVWWSRATLGELTLKLVDGSHNPPKKKQAGLPMLSAVNISNNKIEFSDYRLIGEHEFAEEHKRTRVGAGDVLLTIVGAIGRAAVVPEDFRPFTLQRSVAVFTPALLSSKFLMYQLESPRLASFFKNNARGTAQKGVYLGTLGKTEIWFPGLSEQHRIVAKLEALFSELDDGIESLERARQQLEVYRQALLKHAFEGKMTARWREKNTSNIKNAVALRKEILNVRRATWEKTQSKRYKIPVSPDAMGLPVLPASWGWITLDELIAGEPRSLQSGPFGSSLKHSEFRREGLLVIGIDNVGNGKFSLGNQNRLPAAIFDKLRKYQARPGDLLITVMASLGRTCVVPRSLETAIITKHVYRVSMDERYLLPEFYNLALQGPTISRKRMLQGAQGQTRPGLNSSILREIPLPLCSLAEQQEIVARLSQRLSELENLDGAIQGELVRAEVLRQSLLKHAFLGDLVAQDHNEEPTSILLERIRGEIAETKSARKTIKRREAA